MESKENLKPQGTDEVSEGKKQEEKKSTKKAVSQISEKKKATNVKAVIYVGPTIPNNVLISGKVYKKLPEYAVDFISKNPIVGKLVIDVLKLAEFKRKVEVKGTEEYRLYSECLKLINEGGIFNVL